MSDVEIHDPQELRLWAIEQTKGSYGTYDISEWINAAERLADYVLLGRPKTIGPPEHSETTRTMVRIKETRG